MGAGHSFWHFQRGKKWAKYNIKKSNPYYNPAHGAKALSVLGACLSKAPEHHK